MSAILAGIAVMLTFGTVWFWVFLIAAFIIITAFEENEKDVFALATVIVTVFLFNLSLPIFRTLLTNPKRTILLIVAYFVVGAVWGFVKWFLFVTRQLELYNERKAEFLHKRKATALNPQLAKDFREYITAAPYGIRPVEVNPQVREHKTDILRWMTYWPFSSLWTLLNDPVRRIFRWIYARLHGSMQKVSDRMFRGATEDMKLASDEEVKVR